MQKSRTLKVGVEFYVAADEPCLPLSHGPVQSCLVVIDEEVSDLNGASELLATRRSRQDALRLVPCQ